MKDSIYTPFVRDQDLLSRKILQRRECKWWFGIKAKIEACPSRRTFCAISCTGRRWVDRFLILAWSMQSVSFVLSTYSSPPLLSSLFVFSHFSTLSVYAGLQNADLIRDNLTPSTRSCFDELNPSRFGVPNPVHSRLFFPKLRHRRIFRP